MLEADGLMILQARNCNEQIPAKLYEYLRARRPVVGLADPEGDTALTLRRFGVAHIAALEDADAIAATLATFIGDVAKGCAPLPDVAAVRDASRLARTRDLARVLDTIERR